MARAVERFGGVDVLVNSTGIFRPAPFEEQTEEHFEEALGSILRPTYWVSQAVVPSMRERGGGAIVNVGSMWAVDAIATTPTSAYSAAQAGRHVLTKNLAIELAGDGIRVNTVALAFVETPAYERFLSPEEAQAVLDSVDGFHPLGRRGSRAMSPRRWCSWPGMARGGSPGRRCRSTVGCWRGGRPRSSRRCCGAESQPRLGREAVGRRSVVRFVSLRRTKLSRGRLSTSAVDK